MLSILILSSMVLHCGSRLGVLSLIYKNRYEITNALHITREKAIAECNSSYFLKKDLKIHHDDDRKSPVSFSFTQEIILFCHPSGMKLTSPAFLFKKNSNCSLFF